MSYFASKATNQQGRDLVQAAENVMDCYKRGQGTECIKKSRDFLNCLEIYLTGASVGRGISKDVFEKKIQNFGDVQWTEYFTFAKRIVFCHKGDKVYQCGVEHNVRFISWILEVFQLVEEDIFKKEDPQYLKNSNYFPWNRPRFHDERANLFYRNAKRAEFYYKSLVRDGQAGFDMYTSLILSRMAAEQYLKALAHKNNMPLTEKKIDKTGKQYEADRSFNALRIDLKDKKIISDALSNELAAVQTRGNNTAHESYASYVMSAIHNLEVLKLCMEFIEKNYH